MPNTQIDRSKLSRPCNRSLDGSRKSASHSHVACVPEWTWAQSPFPKIDNRLITIDTSQVQGWMLTLSFLHPKPSR